jgi:hypothetical protein
MDPVPDPLLLRESGSAGNRTRTSGSVAKNSDHYTTEAVYVHVHRINKINGTVFLLFMNRDSSYVGLEDLTAVVRKSTSNVSKEHLQGQIGLPPGFLVMYFSAYLNLKMEAISSPKRQFAFS